MAETLTLPASDTSQGFGKFSGVVQPSPPPVAASDDYGKFTYVVSGPSAEPESLSGDYGKFNAIVNPVADMTPASNKALDETPEPSAPVPPPEEPFILKSPAQVDLDEARMVREGGPLVNVPQAQIQPDDPTLEKAGKAAYNAVAGFANGLQTPDGIIGILNPLVGVAELGAVIPDLVRKVREADKTPPNSPQRWQAGAEVVGFLALPAVAHAISKIGGEPNASNVQSREPLPQREVRPRMGEETPLRQPDEGIAGPQSETQTPATVAENPPIISSTTEGAQPAPERGETIPSAPSRTTGVANRVLDAEAEAGRIDEIASGEGMTWQEMVDLGREQLNKGADPQEIARRFKRTKRISPTDFAVLRAERERLAHVTNEAEDALAAKPNDPALKAAHDQARKAEVDWIRDVVQPAKTATSDIFRGMQGEAQVDASTFAGLRRLFVDENGRELTPEEALKVKDAASKVKTAQAAEAAATRKLGESTTKIKVKVRLPSDTAALKAHFADRLREVLPC